MNFEFSLPLSLQLCIIFGIEVPTARNPALPSSSASAELGKYSFEFTRLPLVARLTFYQLTHETAKSMRNDRG